MDFVETGGNYNFKSVRLIFPKLDKVFKCVKNQGDEVEVEVLYKNKDDQGDFESIGND